MAKEEKSSEAVGAVAGLWSDPVAAEFDMTSAYAITTVGPSRLS
jgi:hypothetical protein